MSKLDAGKHQWDELDPSAAGCLHCDAQVAAILEIEDGVARAVLKFYNDDGEEIPPPLCIKSES